MTRSFLALHGKMAAVEYYRMVYGIKPNGKKKKLDVKSARRKKRAEVYGPTFSKLCDAIINGMGGSFTEFGVYMDQVLKGVLTEEGLKAIRPVDSPPIMPAPIDGSAGKPPPAANA